MLEVERFEKIMEYLREKKTAPVNVLAKRLFVSEATMRRDLSELERKGLVKRLHGGAILLDGANQELPLYLRERQNTDAKRIISEKASHHIVEGQTIFLDASSTAQYLIKYFENYQNLTIITNGLKTAQELNSLSHRIYCTGGLLLHNSSAYVGDFAADFVRNFNADIMFFSSRGVSESGQITDASREETYIRQVMLQRPPALRAASHRLHPVFSGSCCRSPDADPSDRHWRYKRFFPFPGNRYPRPGCAREYQSPVLPHRERWHPASRLQYQKICGYPMA